MSSGDPTLPVSSLPPQIPGYHILSLAGQGGMGAVYRAQQISTQRVVALKLLSGKAGTDEKSLAQFRYEAEVVARLEHPRIVPLYDYGEYHGMPYLAMRYLPGGTVSDKIASGPIPPQQALRWLGAVAEAIDFAHRRGLIHRDVKPSNMLLDEAGNAYLGDFGIAGAFIQAAEGLPTGSAAYMSPEQGQGQAAGVPSDIYALAVSAFEMLTGHKPYMAETALGTIVRHMQDPVPSARALNPNLPPAVDKALAHGMAKDPAQRPATAEAMVKELAWAATQPAELPPAAAAPRQRASPWIWVGLAAALLLGALVILGGGVAGYAILSRPATVTPTSTRLAIASPQATPVPTAIELPLSDDFSNPASGFQTLSDAGGQMAYQDGLFEITVRQPGLEYRSPSGRLNIMDDALLVDFRQIQGPAESEIGLVCRFATGGTSYTAAAVSASGNYRIWQVRDKQEQPLVDWTPIPGSSGIGLGQHQLGFTCRGPDLVLSLDGTEVGRAVDSDPIPGDIGLLAGLSGAPPMQVTFDNLQVNP
jgi:serine/threonine protein kinase